MASKRLSDLDAAFAALDEAADLEQSEDSARDAVAKYREACSRLDSYASTLSTTAPERTLLVNRREHYRDRAQELSNRLLPVAVAVDPSTQSSSDAILADELYYEEADEALARARCESDGDEMTEMNQPIADTTPPTPSAPPLEEVDFEPAPLEEVDQNHPRNAPEQSFTSKVNKADQLLDRALSMDEAGKKRSKVINTYVEAGEIYLDAIRLSERGGIPEGGVQSATVLKKKLNMILGRIEELKKAGSSRGRGWLPSPLSSGGSAGWMCGACGGRP